MREITHYKTQDLRAEVPLKASNIVNPMPKSLKHIILRSILWIFIYCMPFGLKHDMREAVQGGEKVRYMITRYGRKKSKD